MERTHADAPAVTVGPQLDAPRPARMRRDRPIAERHAAHAQTDVAPEIPRVLERLRVGELLVPLIERTGTGRERPKGPFRIAQTHFVLPGNRGGAERPANAADDGDLSRV